MRTPKNIQDTKGFIADGSDRASRALEQPGSLGTHAEQHEEKADSRRLDFGVLSDQKAHLGAERLVLVLAMDILTDWTPMEHQTLLRRVLFDPATYGRVQFCHRSVQEYLAACRLCYLCERDISIHRSFRLLFGERCGLQPGWHSELRMSTVS